MQRVLAEKALPLPFVPDDVLGAGQIDASWSKHTSNLSAEPGPVADVVQYLTRIDDIERGVSEWEVLADTPGDGDGKIGIVGKGGDSPGPCDRAGARLDRHDAPAAARQGVAGNAVAATEIQGKPRRVLDQIQSLKPLLTTKESLGCLNRRKVQIPAAKEGLFLWLCPEPTDDMVSTCRR